MREQGPSAALDRAGLDYEVDAALERLRARPQAND